MTGAWRFKTPAHRGRGQWRTAAREDPELDVVCLEFQGHAPQASSAARVSSRGWLHKRGGPLQAGRATQFLATGDRWQLHGLDATRRQKALIPLAGVTLRVPACCDLQSIEPGYRRLTVKSMLDGVAQAAGQLLGVPRPGQTIWMELRSWTWDWTTARPWTSQ